ncbi:MAG TPA: hypothetical protein VFM48_08305 [Aquabacterium sp.]|nr:hypothetical protein [Aquabacterium sp.]
MPKIICTLENASHLINGVKFIEHEAGRISEEVSEEVAALFASIPGYQREVVKALEVSKEELLARAAKVGLTVKGNWGLARLKAEVEGAEEDAAEAASQTSASDANQSAQVPASVSVTTGDNQQAAE